MSRTQPWRSWCLWAALVVPAGILYAQERTAAPTADQLIEDLGNDSWRVRQAAQEGLMRMGQSVRPQLERLAAETTDPEINTRVEAVLRELEDGRLSGPTPITLRLQNATPKQAFAELARQGYADIRPNPPELFDARVFAPADLDINGEPFWEAVMKLCRQWELVATNSGPGQLTIAPADAASRPGERAVGVAPYGLSGAFMVAAVNINRTHTVDLGARNNTRRFCSVQLLILPEPKVRILQGSSSPTILEAIDEHGNSLRSPAAQVEHMQNPYTPVWTTHCQLTLPPEAGQRIATLRGQMRFVVQTRVETGVIDNPLAARNAEAVVAGRTFILKELAQEGDKYVAKITAQRGALNANEFAGATAPIQFRLLDAQGAPLERYGVPQMKSNNPEQAEIEVRFQRTSLQGGQPTGEPVRLVWDVPTDAREIEVPFEFQDLPLP